LYPIIFFQFQESLVFKNSVKTEINSTDKNIHVPNVMLLSIANQTLCINTQYFAKNTLILSVTPSILVEDPIEAIVDR
jgi:hypothetical protein